MARIVNLDEFSKPMKVKRSLTGPHAQVETALAREEEARRKPK